MSELSVLEKLLGKFAKSETIRDLVLWQIVGQAIGAASMPYQEKLTELVSDLAPTSVLQPQDMAMAVVRGFMQQTDAEAEARKAGFDKERFDTMIELAGTAPAPEFLAEALRRGFIPEDSGDPAKAGFTQGIKQGQLADKWQQVIKDMAVQSPSPAMALNAYLNGQTDEATAKKLFREWGGDERYFDLLFNTEGNAPTPVEALQMANRGIIPWKGTGPKATSYEQAFLEGPWRNKWLDAYEKLGEHLPPPRTISAILKNGAISKQEAITLWRKSGLSQKMAEAYATDALTSKTATTKNLTYSTVETLYEDRLIDKTQFEKFLEVLGYDSSESGLIVAMVDIRREEKALRSAVSRVHSLYVGHKINKTAALNALNELSVPGNEVTNLIQTWDLELNANIKVPSESQIRDAFKDQIIDQTEAMQKLEEQGYQPHDAWMLLCITMKQKLPNEPPKDLIVPAAPKI